MPELIDQYFLVDTRDAKFVTQFLDKYVPEREPVTDSYLITTEAGEEEIDSKNIDLVLSFYEEHVTGIDNIYLKNLDEKSWIAFAIVAYTDDGKMILGISALGTFDDVDDMRENIKIFNDIKAFTNSAVACMTLEEPPPNNSIEFVEFARQRELL
ncbi:hypothetical protein L3C95_34670 [Chitinophaga filiformis]|uniref:hypothetical protein n=1 Tax=Chitinophaga filiformis TaxID=104663 RepID=UPI001F157D14|nr:hypothetical protein [Chitinophaga filiformis]MCF6408084.1 hypothetical protein [Chitinophaga filiformis]